MVTLSADKKQRENRKVMQEWKVCIWSENIHKYNKNIYPLKLISCCFFLFGALPIKCPSCVFQGYSDLFLGLQWGVWTLMRISRVFQFEFTCTPYIAYALKDERQTEALTDSYVSWVKNPFSLFLFFTSLQTSSIFSIQSENIKTPIF